MRAALVNTNRIRPPIAPVGLEYCAQALSASGCAVETLDLCWEDDPAGAVERFFRSRVFDLVGVTLRNIDDSACATRRSFLPDFREMIAEIRKATEAVIILGGVGFSIAPEDILKLCPAAGGVWGDGEGALGALARAIDSGTDWRSVPGLVHRSGEGYRRNPPAFSPLDSFPRGERRFFDHRRYFREGGQAGFETKRGCPAACVFCADPLAKGRSVRLRSPALVAEEVAGLLAQGIDHLHTCDSEFNLPESHAREVCREFVRKGLSEKMRWYAYCSPRPFSRELARLMKRAGCWRVFIGLESVSPETLKDYNKGQSVEEMVKGIHAFRDSGIGVHGMFVVGSDHDTEQTSSEIVNFALKHRI
ncbi:MAG: radical SAM protein, partial [Candidatus Aureabacteria bacterium]|nr:radical SAM protein [Candidatus Auribacterota bacterium]